MRSPAHTIEEYNIIADAIVEVLSDGVPRSCRWIRHSLNGKGLTVTVETITQSCKRDARIEKRGTYCRGIEYGLVEL